MSKVKFIRIESDGSARVYFENGTFQRVAKKDVHDFTNK